ncbi:sirohydrochlorin chelatase [Corynebacterium sp. 20_84]
MTALITLSHGSRHPGAKLGVSELTQAAARQLGVTGIDAHLEFDAPDLTAAARVLAERGHTRAVVVPTLFTKAFHATHDVPEAIAEATAETGLELIPAAGLGQGRDVAAVLAARALIDAPRASHIILYPVGTSNEKAAGKTIELGRDVEKLTGMSVTTVPATGHGGLVGADGIAAVADENAHLLPLFVTRGLLLDRVCRMWPGTISAPLGADLAHIVAARYLAAQSLSHAKV